jgi:hypothetical protein
MRIEAEQSQQAVVDAWREEGAGAAIQKFFAITRLIDDDREPDVDIPRPTDVHRANMRFFLTRDFPVVRRYFLDIEALKASGVRIVPAGGRASRAQWPYHCAVGLAAQLDVSLEELPGGHSGYMTHPAGFAERLRQVFRVQ